jgi:peptidoglycan/LPS O-acetylase OafA/YrhL
MTLTTDLANRIRGWFPTNPNLTVAAKASKVNMPSKFKLPKQTILLFSIFTVTSVGHLLEGNALGATMLWFSCILVVSFVLDILVSRGKDLNIKYSMVLLVAVIVLGGVFANLYVFSVSSSFFIRLFSIIMLVVVSVPLAFAIVAYVWGKKELSKKLVGWFSARSAE